MKKILFLLSFIFINLCINAQTLTPVCFNYLNNINTPSVGINPYSITNADFNADGLQDLATANYGSNNVSVLVSLGNGAFMPSVNYSVGTNPCSIKNSDFNNDGKTDLVIVNKGSNNISILFGLPGGVFSSAVNYSVGTTPNSVFVSDFNNDANQDLVIANFGSNNISVLLGSSTGTFSSVTNYSVGTNPHSILSADFNQDGKLDLAVTNMGSNKLNILLGNGFGGFSLPSVISNGFGLSNMTYLAGGDFNVDGNFDLAIVNSSGDISIFSGNASGGFAFSSSINVNYSEGTEIVAGDFNSDSKIDLAVLYTGDNVAVLLGNGNGSFTFNGFYNSGSGSKSIVTSDFNGDSKLDFAVTNLNTNKISIVFGIGNGSFSTSVNYNSGNGSLYGICTGDFNGDGNLDFSTGSQFANAVYVHLGDGNGLFSTAVAGYNTMTDGRVVAADFNGDGKTDIATCGSSSTTNSVAILIGLGTGSFAPVSFFGTGMGNGPIDLTCADFNGDGKKDIATANSTGNSISVFLGTGTGSLSSATNYAAGGGQRSIQNADFNGDGFIDLAVSGGNSVRVFFGNGNGTFNPYSFYPIGTESYGITTGDFNNDGNIDLASANYYSNDVTVLSGSATGTFVSIGSYTIAPYMSSVYSVDFNNDGNLDLVAGSNYNGRVISFLLGTGTGLFNTPISYDIGNGASRFTSGDFNGDGTADLALVDGTTTKVFIKGNTPTITISGSTLTCSGNSINLSASGGNYYNWSTGSTTSTISVSPSSNISYSVTGISSTGCGITSIHTISVNPTPTITVNSGTICIGNSFTMAPSGAVSYTYSGGSDVVNPTTSSSYTVSGEDALGCIGIALSNVTVNPIPTIIVNSGAICSGQSFTIMPNGASTYTFSGGSDIISPTADASYSITGTGANGCIGNAISSVTVYTLPTLTITGTNTVCLGSSTTLTVSSAGATTYNWSTGAFSPIANITPTVSSTYTVTGTDFNGCSNSETVSITVDNTCADVWPGDANSDGVADNLDVLELGLHYTQTGAPRATIDNSWQSYFATNWVGTITNGKNLNHSDCNGDGIISDDDTLAIFNNYGLTHAFKTVQTTTVNPQLSIIPDQSVVAKGTWGTASIYLGDATTNINNINGIAFTVDFDNTLIESNNIYIEYQNSFIDVSQNLHFRKLDFANGKIFTATTHTVNNNVNGFGKIATLHYQIKSSLATDEVLNIGIVQANQSDASGLITPLTSGSGTLMAVGASVGIKEVLNSSNVSVSPNPTSGVLNIAFSKLPQNTTIEIYNSIGALMLTEVLSSKNNTINTSQLSNGMYLIKVLENNRITTVQKIVKQ